MGGMKPGRRKKMEGVKKDEQHTLMELDSISPIHTSIAPNVIVVLIYFIFSNSPRSLYYV
jgi:hypothetical protein